MSDWPPPPIKHRSVQNHYTTQVSYIAQCTYTHGRLPPCNEAWIPWILLHQTCHISWHIYIYLEECTYTCGRLTPHSPPIEHRCLEYHYTKLGRFRILHNAHICMADGTPSIDCSCIQDHYTKYVSHIGECTYILMAEGPPVNWP